MHRRRLRPDPVLGSWCDLLDELETGGSLMRELVREALGSETSQAL
jgi:hypothetical protein